MSDDENNWGRKKMTYYSMNKNENDDKDSDFIEEEKEAIKKQKEKLQKIQKSKILLQNEEEIETKEKEVEKETQKNKKLTEEENKEILENISLCKSLLDQTFKEIKPTKEILSSNDSFKVPLTVKYLEAKEKFNNAYALCLLFSVVGKLKGKISKHHSSAKAIATFDYLLNKNKEIDEQIQTKIDDLLEKYQEEKENEEKDIDENKMLGKKTKRKEEEMNEEEEEEENEENEDLNDLEEEGEDLKDLGEEENEDLNDLGEEGEEMNDLGEDEEDELNDLEDLNLDNNNVDINKNKENKSSDDQSSEEENIDDDDFIKSQMKQYKNLNKTNKENKLKAKQKLQNEIKRKNDLAVEKANREVLLARGIYRKRKSYKGNAKVANREKFFKRQKQRKAMVKEFEGKPDVYMGEATGIRRDLIRSTKMKS